MTEEQPNKLETDQHADFSQMIAHKEAAHMSDTMHKQYIKVDETVRGRDPQPDTTRTNYEPSLYETGGVHITLFARKPPLEHDDEKIVIEHDGCGS